LPARPTRFLINDRDGAKADFEESITLDPKLIQSRVKLASVHMELGNITDTFGDFEAALAEDPTDPDIYYHRGQVYFIAGELDKALDDYTKSSELDPAFIFSHIQKAVTLYRQGKTAPSMAEFRRVLKQFPDRSEPYNYYGELLLAENRFGDALEKFDKAVEIEAKK
jgi:import receptor subunit TOM70